ncbi:hypothetical protein BDV12DRAFT_203369 [Aspergillus spectabilis]
MPPTGKIILITSASKAISQATAQRVATEGASVVIRYNSNATSANSPVKEIGEERALAVQADVSKMPDLDRLVDAAVTEFGEIDVLIPNAGILPMRCGQHRARTLTLPTTSWSRGLISGFLETGGDMDNVMANNWKFLKQAALATQYTHQRQWK